MTIAERLKQVPPRRVVTSVEPVVGGFNYRITTVDEEDDFPPSLPMPPQSGVVIAAFRLKRGGR